MLRIEFVIFMLALIGAGVMQLLVFLKFFGVI
jgi:hypothetical protein